MGTTLEKKTNKKTRQNENGVGELSMTEYRWVFEKCSFDMMKTRAVLRIIIEEFRRLTEPSQQGEIYLFSITMLCSKTNFDAQFQAVNHPEAKNVMNKIMISFMMMCV